MIKFDYNGIAMNIAVQTDGRPKKLCIRFRDFYMTSGWRFTSTINFLVETIVTHTCLAKNAGAFYKLRGSKPDGEVVMEKFPSCLGMVDSFACRLAQRETTSWDSSILGWRRSVLAR